MILYQSFNNTAKKFPTNTALVCNGNSLTYSETLVKIEEYSQFLSIEITTNKNGLLIYCKKSFHNVLWQLIANKLGHVFINADINTPLERVAYMLEITTPKWIITEHDIDMSNLGYQKIHTVDDVILWIKISNDNRLNDLQKQCEGMLTHIYFSSGSTGKPKAILLNDEPIIGVVKQQAEQIYLTSKSKFAWLLSPSFDASLSDIYSTLLSGACLHICTFKMSQIKTLYKYFKEHEITHSDLSPSVLSLIDPNRLPDLKSVIFGGEVANEKVIHSWFNNGINMYNAYGPTEATICSSLKTVDNSWTANNIGQPLNAVFYHMFPTAVENQFELYISGSYLALGYDQPKLTESKFITIDNIRYYKTGDLVKRNEHGDYLFLGRADRQFKYNGVLISPEEIENYCFQSGCLEVLCKLEDKITLYYSGNITQEYLKEQLALKLPSSMIPQKWVQKEQLVKNINGKIQL